MKRVLLAALALPVLALLWAALHDIRRGEPDLVNEYAAVGFSILILAGLAWKTFRPNRSEASR